MTAEISALQRRLAPLMAPKNVAVIGASGRPGRPGNEILKAYGVLGAQPRLYPVTPSYDAIEGLSCCASTADLPEAVDLAVIASGPSRVVADAMAAIVRGARALHVLGVAQSPEGLDRDRLEAMAREQGTVLLGPNSIGYINYVTGALSTWIPPAPGYREAGSIALILQSGALYSYANAVDPRLRFSFTCQPGQEAGVTTAELMLYALSMPETKVIGLYLEQIRDPDVFMAALKAAQGRDIPVVILKPGRTVQAAQAIETHTGRLAGSDAGFVAAFGRYGVCRVENLDEFWTTLRLFSAEFRIGPGGVAAITDSGGQRSLMLDEATRIGLPLAKFSPSTVHRLAGILAPELSPENPVDIWGGEEDLVGHASACLSAALDDPDTAVAMVITEFGAVDTDGFPSRMGEAAIRAAANTSKPVVAASFSTRHFAPETILNLDRSGIPVLDGLPTALRALGHLLDRRDRPKRRGEPDRAPTAPSADLMNAVAKLRPASEQDALAILQRCGVPVVASLGARDKEAARAAAKTIGYPVVLKTAENIAHKTEAKGVVLGIQTEAQLDEAYLALSQRLGPAVTVAAMIPSGVELAIGTVLDPNFGPLVMVGAGGAMIEFLDDAAFGLAPIGPEEALSMLRSLRLWPLLQGLRGAEPVGLGPIVKSIVAVSELAAAFRSQIEAIDVNPVIAAATGCVAVDALISLQSKEHEA